MAAGRQWCTAIKNSDVIETEKAALKDVHPVRVFTIHPPGEVQEQLLEDSLKEDRVADSTSLLLDLVNAPGGPRVNWRIHSAKRPLVCSQLSVRVHVPLAQHQHELLFRKL